MRGFRRDLRRCQKGQATSEYMLLLAVIVGEVVLIYYLLAPPIRESFINLAKLIIKGGS
jgi:hypothetical protein